MRIAIRPAGPDDAALMHRLSLQAWRGTVSTNSSLFDETVEYVAGILRDGGGFILEVDDEPSGSVRHFPVGGDATVWEVKRLGVIAAWRGRGLGERLMQAVTDEARRQAVRRLQIGIRADQPRLIRFYETLGFRLDDSVRLSAQNPRTAPAITMSRTLDAQTAPRATGPRVQPGRGPMA